MPAHADTQIVLLQDHSFKLNQVDSSVGSVHASPGVHASPVSTSHDDIHSAPMHSPLSCQVAGDCGDEMGGMHPLSPHAAPGQAEEMSNKSMAAAHSALLEMQNQGLSYQNIEELVQNIQNLLNCLRVRTLLRLACLRTLARLQQSCATSQDSAVFTQF